MKLTTALLFVFLLGSCASTPVRGCASSARGCETRFRAVRLHPGDDLRESLERFVKQDGAGAAFVASCAGSLEVAAIRFADQQDATTLEGPFEIVSLSGTLSVDGTHLHIAVADRSGRTIGGHLAPGAKVYTTAEIVVGELQGARFRREVDPATTYKELVIE